VASLRERKRRKGKGREEIKREWNRLEKKRRKKFQRKGRC
jgi:hypothetical protein